jgi:MFS family permease
VAVATLVGTTLETYDFVLYAQAAALVFGDVFFPQLSPAAGTLAAFSTFAVAFVARPIGAVVFGHFGDRIGRKAMLVTALVMSGAATFGIGALPGHDTLGLAAPVVLVMLRFLQGVGLGGEWSGSILLAAEHAPAGRRGGYASFTQIGANVGPLLASAAMLTLSATLSDDAFRSWGWRIPFLIGGALMAVGIYVRLAVAESPLFLRDVATVAAVPPPGPAPAVPPPGADAEVPAGPRASRRTAAGASRLPVWDVMRRRPRMLLLATGALMVVYLLAYIIYTFALTYGLGLGISRTTMLTALLIASVVNTPAVALIALLSDRVGRRPVCLTGAIAAIAWAYPMLALIHTRSLLWVTVSFTVAVIIATLVFAPMGAYLPELFDTQWRYSGVAVSSNVAAILGGGLGPIVATALLAAVGSIWSVAGYLAVIALISLACIWLLPETYRRSLARESQP